MRKKLFCFHFAFAIGSVHTYQLGHPLGHFIARYFACGNFISIFIVKFQWNISELVCKWNQFCVRRTFRWKVLLETMKKKHIHRNKNWKTNRIAYHLHPYYCMQYAVYQCHTIRRHKNHSFAVCSMTTNTAQVQRWPCKQQQMNQNENFWAQMNFCEISFCMAINSLSVFATTESVIFVKKTKLIKK